mgnify:CR=1 FL=1
MSARRLIRLGLIAPAALALVPNAASAQAGIASEEECARAPSPEEELACLRGALAASRRALAEANGADPTPPPAQQQRREVVAAPSAPAPVRAPTPNLGQEQVARAEPERRAEAAPVEAVTATVTDVRQDVRGLLVMQLDNGQIWRQDESIGGPIRLAENQRASVEITRSGFGGYRMRFPELGRRIAVSRLR